MVVMGHVGWDQEGFPEKAAGLVKNWMLNRKGRKTWGVEAKVQVKVRMLQAEGAVSTAKNMAGLEN